MNRIRLLGLTMVVALLALVATPASAITLHWASKDLMYTGINGEDQQDEYTWQTTETRHSQVNRVTEDPEMCPYEFTEPELCPEWLREWYVENTPLGVGDRSCTMQGCEDELNARCQNRDFARWVLNPQSPEPDGHCKASSFYGSIFTAGPICSCECEGANMGGREVVIIAMCTYGTNDWTPDWP